jgi:hypothetical protein
MVDDIELRSNHRKLRHWTHDNPLENSSNYISACIESNDRTALLTEYQLPPSTRLYALFVTLHEVIV